MRKTPLDGLPEPGNYQRRKIPVGKVGLSVGALLVLVAATIGAFALGRNMVTHAATAINEDCTLIVPNRPLTAAGLATPYQLVATDPNQGACNETNPMQSAFVQGAIIDPATGQISIYNPLVIDQGTKPAVLPGLPQLPANAVIGLWFGSNGDTLRLGGDTGGGNCVGGLHNDPFGQFSYCNAPKFFAAANQAIRDGKLAPPALGTGKDGKPCPTVRDFTIVDQDQSDNVTTTYLFTSDGRVAPNTAVNRAGLAGAQVQSNGSDNALEAIAVDTALGCTPWMAPNLADDGAMVPALPLNELQAAADQAAPVAIVPDGDPMVLSNGQANQRKRNLYRQGVDQPTDASGDTAAYCQNMLANGPARFQLDMQFTMDRPSPDAGAATNLFTFLAQRFNASLQNLNCAGQSPITLQQDANGVTTGATINLNGQISQPTPTTPAQPTPTTPAQPTPTTPAQPTPTATTPPAGGGGGGVGTTNGPDCVVNGTVVPGCMGTTTINGKSCTISFNAANKQVIITCP
ncbi:MAG TPA: hypothetical protein VFU32_08320 [Ktedonobacterales bacterium]|nr:hypothetical protein [Ktedonobacterales bacterium]